MRASEAFFTRNDLQRATTHLKRLGNSVMFTMHTGQTSHVVEIHDPENSFRVEGLLASGGAVTLDASRVESFAFLHDELEVLPEPPLASSELMALSIDRQKVVDEILDAIDAEDLAKAKVLAEHVRALEDEMRALADTGRDILTADRPHEFGGYEGCENREVAAGAQPAQPEIGSDGDASGGRDGATVIDHPQRRPPKAS